MAAKTVPYMAYFELAQELVLNGLMCKLYDARRYDQVGLRPTLFMAALISSDFNDDICRSSAGRGLLFADPACSA